MKNVLIPLLTAFLYCHNGNAQTYIKLHIKGDTIPIDTAVVLDIDTYRLVRDYNISAGDYVGNTVKLLESHERQLYLMDSINNTCRIETVRLKEDVARKDSLNTLLYRNFNKLDSLAVRTYQIIEKRTRPMPFYSKWEFWGGVGLGVLSGVFIAKYAK